MSALLQKTAVNRSAGIARLSHPRPADGQKGRIGVGFTHFLRLLA
jgi:hypothetical protein